MEQGGIDSAEVSLSDRTLSVVVRGNETADALAQRLTRAVSEHGYGVHVRMPAPPARTHEWFVAVPIAFGFLILFWVLGEAGIVRMGGTSDTALVTAFMVGLVASVSTCLAVVGGLLLSVSATYARSGAGKKPQVLFHLGRLGGFAVFGGALGALGDVFSIGFGGATILGGVVAVVMLILGLHLMELTPKVRAITLPASMGGAVSRMAGRVGGVAPSALGVSTFFLPCGFTQSMQVLALSSGSMLTGSLIMTVFALGTFPVLALISFGSLDLAKSRFRGVFFKVAGLIVITFALFTLQNTLVYFGIINPLITL